jgi:hypothetical protein
MKRLAAAFQSGLRTLLPACRDVSRLQSQALDQTIAWPKRLGLGLHLLVCKWCRRYGKQIRFLRHVVRDNPEHLHESAPRRLTTESRERIEQLLRDQM